MIKGQYNYHKFTWARFWLVPLGLEALNRLVFSVVEEDFSEAAYSRLLVLPLYPPARRNWISSWVRIGFPPEGESDFPPEEHSMNSLALAPAVGLELLQLGPVELEAVSHILPADTDVLRKSHKLIGLE